MLEKVIEKPEKGGITIHIDKVRQLSLTSTYIFTLEKMTDSRAKCRRNQYWQSIPGSEAPVQETLREIHPANFLNSNVDLFRGLLRSEGQKCYASRSAIFLLESILAHSFFNGRTSFPV